MLRSAAAVVLPDAEVFELGLVCEVFGTDRSDEGVPRVDFTLVTEHPGRVPTAAGFAVEVTTGLEAAADADLVVVVPAADRHAPAPPAVTALLRATVARGARVLSVCSAAFVLGQAGLLDGRRCTTHWLYADELAARFPLARVDPSVLYVDEGPVVTSAGSAAGIDAALHVVRQELGAVAAAAVARRMVVPPHRDGGQAQYVSAPLPACADADLAPLLEWAVGHLDADLSVEALARRARTSPRTFARRFTASTGTSPGAWVARQRLQRARELLEGSDLSVEVVAERVGWGSAAVLRHHFAALGTTPLAYRRTFAGEPVQVRPAGPARLVSTGPARGTSGHQSQRRGSGRALEEVAMSTHDQPGQSTDTGTGTSRLDELAAQDQPVVSDDVDPAGVADDEDAIDAGTGRRRQDADADRADEAAQ